MNAKSISDTSSNNSTAETAGKMLMFALVIVAIIPLVIGYWASQSGGGL